MILFKATLASIPSYYLSIFTIPGSVADKMEVLFRNFLWNDTEDSHRYYLVDWKSICKPKVVRGLRLRSIMDYNKALLVKWLWRFGIDNDSLWHRVVIVRFGLASVWETRRVRCRHGYGLWKSIMRLREAFWNLVSFKVGSGSDICFWAD